MNDAPDSLRIRRAAVTDGPALTELMRRSRAYQGRYASILAGYEVSAAQLARDEVHAGTVGECLAGFYSLVVAADDAELDLLFVDDAHQGRGFGARLFEHMRTQAIGRGCRAVRIVSHPPAERFYQRMGAERVGTKPASGRVT